MPWKSSSAKRFTHKAKSPTAKRQWAAVANNVLKSTGSESRAIKAANAAVRKRGRR